MVRWLIDTEQAASSGTAQVSKNLPGGLYQGLQRNRHGMSSRRRPTTDLGTVILHWVMVAAFGAAALSGLRIAADEPGLAWLTWLNPVLPTDNLWLWHVGAGTSLTATLAAYAVYVIRARLQARVSLDATHLRLLTSSGRQRWGAAGSVAYWLMIAALLLVTASGFLLFDGFGGSILSLHLLAAWVCLVFPFAHVGLHWANGGWNQVLRIVRPTALVVANPPPDFAELLAHHLERGSMAPVLATAATASGLGGSGSPARVSEASRRRPMLWALIIGFILLAGVIGLEPMTRQYLVVPQIAAAAAPRLNGDLSDPAWSGIPVTTLLTQHGANFGGGGESLVEVRAVHDNTNIYFAFTWTDPTRSLKHLPLIKHQDGWHLVETAHDVADEQTYFEDKFAVLISRPVLPLIGAAIHLAAKPLAGMPGGLTGRGLHYTANGSFADVWQWHADHANIIDDGVFSGPAQPHPDQVAGHSRYTGGYTAYRGRARYADNFDPHATDDTAAPLRPRRLPKDIAAMATALGRISDSPENSEADAARWWMTEAESAPYSDAADAEIPIDTVIPGVIVFKMPNGVHPAITGAARWSAGRWTLTLTRTLAPPADTDVRIETGSMLWVAAFDHAETRHTRHLRPLTLELQNAQAP